MGLHVDSHETDEYVFPCGLNLFAYQYNTIQEHLALSFSISERERGAYFFFAELVYLIHELKYLFCRNRKQFMRFQTRAGDILEMVGDEKKKIALLFVDGEKKINSPCIIIFTGYSSKYANNY